MMAAQSPSSDSLTTILTSALESRGVLGKIRAELRASVFSAIHEQTGGGASSKSAALTALHEDGAGRLAAQVGRVPLSNPPTPRLSLILDSSNAFILTLLPARFLTHHHLVHVARGSWCSSCSRLAS